MAKKHMKQNHGSTPFHTNWDDINNDNNFKTG